MDEGVERRHRICIEIRWRKLRRAPGGALCFVLHSEQVACNVSWTGVTYACDRLIVRNIEFKVCRSRGDCSLYATLYF